MRPRKIIDDDARRLGQFPKNTGTSNDRHSAAKFDYSCIVINLGKVRVNRAPKLMKAGGSSGEPSRIAAKHIDADLWTITACWKNVIAALATSGKV